MNLFRSRGREPSEEGPLLQRLADCKMKLPDILPGSHDALVQVAADTIVCLCRLTVRAYDMAGPDEFTCYLTISGCTAWKTANMCI